MKQNLLTPKQLKELKEKTNCKSNLSSSSTLRDFFDLFFVCEAIARKLIYYHNSKKQSDNYNIRQLQAAIKHFSLTDESILDNIFKSKGKVGNKTCRQLRNCYIHNVPCGKQEIEDRFIVLKDYMEKWIDIFEKHNTK